MKITGEICNPMKPVEDCQAVMLVVDNSQAQQPQIDYAQSAEFWGVAFTSVLFLWLFSHGIGHILKLVKNA